MTDTAPRMTRIPLSVQKEMPWKNGGGMTREVFKAEDGSGILWRASIATIHQSGPFSLFQGCDRIITLIDGPPVALDFADGEQMVLETFEPQHFSCDRPVSAAVSGTSNDLNLIWRRDVVSVTHRVYPLHGSTAVSLPPARWHLIVVCGGPATVATNTGKRALMAGEAVLFDGPGQSGPGDVALSSDGATAILFTIR